LLKITFTHLSKSLLKAVAAVYHRAIDMH